MLRREKIKGMETASHGILKRQKHPSGATKTKEHLF
jgi:hypothetical protein